MEDQSDTDGSGRSLPHKVADIEVTTPLLERIVWPQRCALCGTPNTTFEKQVSHTFKSGEYLVARKNTTLTWKGIRLCSSCNKRTSLSPLQIILMALGVVLGFVSVVVLAAINSSLICGWLIVGLLVLLGFILFATFGTGRRTEPFPVDFKVMTEGKEIGRNRPTRYSFKFRNQMYADEFRTCNGLSGNEGYFHY